MKRCINCVLPEAFPGIHFNDEGVCNICLSFKGKENLDQKKQEYKEKFEILVEKYKGQETYDALMSYSGGKDSTYTLYILKESFGLNILAVTLDNGFISNQSFENIQKVAEKLCIDHVFFKPRFNILKKIFVECSKRNIYPPTTLTRASTICTSCMAIVKFSSLRLALEKNIPFIIFGWSPGQIPITSSIMKNNPQFVKMTQKNLYEPLYDLVGNDINPYFLEEKYFKFSHNFPYNISPLAFLDYDEEKILKRIKSLGWKVPQDVDVHSTNCLLNSFANIVHKKQYGFDPYVFELSKLVREGHLDRLIALQKLNQFEDPTTLDFVKIKLSL
jgi:hypothetical protein